MEILEGYRGGKWVRGSVQRDITSMMGYSYFLQQFLLYIPNFRWFSKQP